MITKAMKRDEVAKIGLPNEVTLKLLTLNISITAGIGISAGYHHSDWQPRKEADVKKLFDAVKGCWSWNAQPCEMIWTRNGVIYHTACAIHTMPHDKHLHGLDERNTLLNGGKFSYRIQGSIYQANAEGNAGHFCLHYIDSMEIRFKSLQTNPAWWQRMNKAVHEAVKLSGTPVSQPASSEISTTINTKPMTQTHIIQPGETMSRIANMYGIPLKTLTSINPDITDPDKIVAGNTINIIL